MRIISGKHKGRRLSPPGSINTRPTTDFAKEGLFSIIGNHLGFKDMPILDLFAGTGSISYEFASRGASPIHAVEIDPRHCRYIRKTIRQLELSQIQLFQTDAFSFIPKSKRQYRIIFADPPYDLKQTGLLPKLIFERKMILNPGWFVLEHPRKLDFSDHPYFFDHKKYGNVHFSFFSSRP